MLRIRFIGGSNVPVRTGNAESGWDILVLEWPYLVPQDIDLPVMLIKGTSFCPELIFKTNSKPLANFTENAIFRIFIISFPVEFKSFNVFLIKCVMKVTCKLKSAETFIQENLKFGFGTFSPNNNT